MIVDQSEIINPKSALPLAGSILLTMRVVGEISHIACKITVFAWNNRYLIKFEQGLLEQTYKVNEYDVTSEGDLYKIVDEVFIQEAVERFGDMRSSLQRALQRA